MLSLQFNKTRPQRMAQGRPTDRRARGLGLLSSLLVSALSAMAGGQDLTHKAPPQTTPISLINVAIYPVSGPVIERGYITFDQGLITALGAGQPTPAPQGAQVIDGEGKRRVYPGLISAYTQVGLTEIQAVPQSIDIDEAGSVTPEVVAATAVNPDSTLIPVTRSNGILTTVTFPDGGMFPGQPSVIRLDGWTTTEMTIRRSVGQVLRWPNMRTFTAWWITDSEEDQRKNITRDLRVVETVMEAARSYAVSKSADPTIALDLRYEAMRGLFSGNQSVTDSEAVSGTEAANGSSTLFIHANTVDQLHAVADLAKRFGQRVVVIGGREAPLCAAVLNELHIGVIVLGTHNLPVRDDLAYDDCFTLPLRLQQAGIPFAIAHSDDTAHERNLPYHAATAVAYGLSPEAALYSITLQPAKFAGVDKSLGSLEVGKAATLLLTDGDVLEVTTKVESAYIDGRLLDLSNKQTKLAEKYRARYKQQTSPDK